MNPSLDNLIDKWLAVFTEYNAELLSQIVMAEQSVAWGVKSPKSMLKISDYVEKRVSTRILPRSAKHSTFSLITLVRLLIELV